MKFKYLALLITPILFMACDRGYKQQMYVQQPQEQVVQPVVVEQQPQIILVPGHPLFSDPYYHSYGYYHSPYYHPPVVNHTTVINKTVVNKTTVNTPAPVQQSRPAPAPQQRYMPPAPQSRPMPSRPSSFSSGKRR